MKNLMIKIWNLVFYSSIYCGLLYLFIIFSFYLSDLKLEKSALAQTAPVTLRDANGNPITSLNPLSTSGGSVGSSTTTVIKGSTSGNGLEVNPNNSLPVEENFATTPATFNTVNQALILATGGRNSAAFSLTSSGLTTVTITPYISVDGGLSYVASHLINPTTLAGSLTASFSGTSPSGTYFIAPIGPATHVKIVATSLSAGSTAVLNLTASWANTFALTTTSIPLQ